MHPEPQPERDTLPSVRQVRWWQSWRATLAALFLLVVLVVALAEVARVGRAYEQAEADTLQRHAEMAESLAGVTETFIDRYSAIAQTTAQAIFAGRPTDAERRRLLSMVRGTHPEIVSITVIGRDGRVVDADPVDLVGRDLADRGYYRRLLNGGPVIVTDLLPGRATGTLDIVVAAGSRGPNGEFRGAVGVRPSIDRLAREINPRLDKGAHALVVDRAGRAVAADPDEKLDWTQRDYSTVPIVAQALAGRAARSRGFEAPAGGGRLLGAMTPIPSLGWAAGVVQPVETALADARGERRIALVTVGTVLLLGASFALFAAERLSRPIVALAAGASALMRGDLAHRVQVRGRNELGQLADHFNAMAMRLEQARAREQAAVGQTRAAQERLAFLAESSARMAASLDYEATLKSVARLVVPFLGDGCIVDLADADLSVRPLAVAHVDPVREALLAELQAAALDPGADHPAARALRTGRPQVAADVTEAWMEAVSRDGAQLELWRRLGPRSYMAVPLLTRGRTLGVISFLSASRRYGPADERLATNIAERAAIAVDNARLFRAAQEAVHQAQAAVRSRDAFLARASHELRTPLTSALGSTRMLQKVLSGSVAEAPEGLVAIASRNLEHMATLIDDLLDASKLAAGAEQLALTAVDLGAVLAASVDAVAAQARERAVSLHVAAPDGLSLRADRLKLEQVFTNLIANAVKFTPSGGNVRVDSEAEREAIVVRIRDTGEGIAEEHLELIFEPFYQVHPAAGEAGAGGPRARRPRGSGLGLAISRQIVALHGGQIWAESEGPGRGSTFVVRLSRASADAQAA